MTEVVSSLNVFVDNENALGGQGDDVLVDIGNSGINAGDGQFLRLTLESFNMYKNFYGVNDYNNVINVNTNQDENSLCSPKLLNHKIAQPQTQIKLSVLACLAMLCLILAQ